MSVSYITYTANPPGRESALRAGLHRMLPYILPVSAFALWELGARTGALDPRFFSSPSAVAISFWGQLASGSLVEHVQISGTRILIGYAIGAIPALAIGLAMGVSKTVRRALTATMNALYPLPKIALIPLFLVLFGLTENMKYATIALGVFFPILINTVSGVANINKIYVDVAKSFGANSFQFYRTVALPGALPFIFAGLRIGYGVALLLIVAAEIVGTTTGIGYMIWNSWQVFRIEDLFIGLILISLLGVLGNGAIRFAERRLVPGAAA
jgi:NitT/TauT family transport system permease protein